MGVLDLKIWSLIVLLGGIGRFFIDGGKVLVHVGDMSRDDGKAVHVRNMC